MPGTLFLALSAVSELLAPHNGREASCSLLELPGRLCKWSSSVFLTTFNSRFLENHRTISKDTESLQGLCTQGVDKHFNQTVVC